MFTTSLTLLERLRDPQDADAWSELVDFYTPFLRLRLRPYCLEADLEDLTQDVLTVMVVRVRAFAHNNHRGAFRKWLHEIVRNKLGDYWRKKNRGLPVSADEQASILEQLADPASELSRRWDKEHAKYVADKLLELIRPDFTPETFEAFRRLVLEEQSTAEVAAALCLTTNAVMIAKSHVLKRLRRELADHPAISFFSDRFCSQPQ
jgi:RNA polymerase sigma factor (sigma-70 family)